MLLWLTELLAKDIRGFNVFGYLTWIGAAKALRASRRAA